MLKVKNPPPGPAFLEKKLLVPEVERHENCLLGSKTTQGSSLELYCDLPLSQLEVYTAKMFCFCFFFSLFCGCPKRLSGTLVPESGMEPGPRQ